MLYSVNWALSWAMLNWICVYKKQQQQPHSFHSPMLFAFALHYYTQAHNVLQFNSLTHSIWKLKSIFLNVVAVVGSNPKKSRTRTRTKWPFKFFSLSLILCHSFRERKEIEKKKKKKKNVLFKSSQIKSQNKLSEREKKKNLNRACGNFVSFFFDAEWMVWKKTCFSFLGCLIVFFLLLVLKWRHGDFCV